MERLHFLPRGLLRKQPVADSKATSNRIGDAEYESDPERCIRDMSAFAVFEASLSSIQEF